MTTTCLSAPNPAARTVRPAVPVARLATGRLAAGRLLARVGILVGMAGSLAAVTLRLG